MCILLDLMDGLLEIRSFRLGGKGMIGDCPNKIAVRYPYLLCAHSKNTSHLSVIGVHWVCQWF